MHEDFRGGWEGEEDIHGGFDALDVCGVREKGGVDGCRCDGYYAS